MSRGLMSPRSGMGRSAHRICQSARNEASPRFSIASRGTKLMAFRDFSAGGDIIALSMSLVIGVALKSRLSALFKAIGTICFCFGIPPAGVRQGRPPQLAELCELRVNALWIGKKPLVFTGAYEYS